MFRFIDNFIDGCFRTIFYFFKLILFLVLVVYPGYIFINAGKYAYFYACEQKALTEPKQDHYLCYFYEKDKKP